MKSYEVGSLVKVSAVFRNTVDNSLVDPTSVRLQIQDPSGFEADVTPVRDSTGVYHYDVAVNTSGAWYYRWSSQGIGKAADEDHFMVETSEFE